MTKKSVSIFLFIFCLLFINSHANSCQDQNIDIAITEIDGSINGIKWAGANNEVIILQTSKGIYTSLNEGDTFEPIDMQGEMSYHVAISAKKTNIVVSSDDSLLRSEDGGATWTRYETPALFRHLNPHPENNEWILALGLRSTCGRTNDCAFDLYLSTDFGKSWGAIRTYIEGYDWHKTTENDNTIVVWEHAKKTGNQFNDRTNLLISVSHDFFGSSTLVSDNTAGFLVLKEHIFFVKTEAHGLSLYSSDDSGATSYQVDLPLDLAEKRYTILDTSEGFTFISVEHDDPTSGYVYESNAFNREFSLTLKDNPRSIRGRCDFSEMRTLEGIYFANQYDIVEEPDDTGVTVEHKLGRRSLITYDKGGIWKRINAPEGTQCTENCFLNLQGSTTSLTKRFYSREQAVGLILATGNVGKYLSLEKDDINTYFSRDAGWTWEQLATGSYIYEMGNAGSLLLLADDQDITNNLLYSFDEGLTLNTCNFTTIEEGVDIYDILSDPLMSSTRFLMVGMRNRKSIIISLNFDSVHERFCSGWDKPEEIGSDYELWEPSDSKGDMCLLGRRTSYVRRKRDSNCLNPPDFVSRKHVLQNCSCTAENYECDYCFVRNENQECVLDKETCPSFDPSAEPETCIDKYGQTQGYRKVPGDSCDVSTGLDLTPVVHDCQSETVIINVNDDTITAIIIVSLPVFGILVLSVSIIYFCTGKNEKVRGCATMCVPEGALPKIEYGQLPMEFGDDLEADASMIDFTSTESSDLDI
eukprot:TRINITY_DN2345_c0_g1_i1.p1 TRINITY_DN2345_c0_g1~~TRINITY_DN2345_c0_g1_i1.p1  ORF type:complete len:755 (-),score=150.26 TRINITY_DN2345_c0_g1_i1:23-2287(-)